MTNQVKFSSLKVDMLKSEFKAMARRRAYWTKHLKQDLLKTFELINEATGLDLHIEKNEDLTHFQSVYIGFKDSSSGIISNLDGTEFMKSGAFLFFSQDANGKITVWMTYPFIEGIKGEPGKEKHFGMFVPKDINQQLVFDYFDDFMGEVLHWECYLRNPIGFNH